MKLGPLDSRDSSAGVRGVWTGLLPTFVLVVCGATLLDAGGAVVGAGDVVVGAVLGTLSAKAGTAGTVEILLLLELL